MSEKEAELTHVERGMDLIQHPFNNNSWEGKASSPSCMKYLEEITYYTIGSTLPRQRDKLLLESIARDWDIREINIGVFGLVGTGKSSFINSVNYVLNGRYVDHMGEGRTDTEDGESITVQRQQLKVATNISIIDNRGIKAVVPPLLSEIVHQCKGHRRMGDEVPETWEPSPFRKFQDIMATICECQCRRICNKIHCPVIIYSLRDEVEAKTMKTIIQAIYKGTGAYPIIALSFLDKREDKEMILKLSAQFQSFHCPRVFALQNYSLSDYKLRQTTHSTILEMMYNCLIVADQVLLKKLGPTGCCC